MLTKETVPKSCQALLKEYEGGSGARTNTGTRLHFKGVGDRDVYNITAPFESDGHMLIAGRVERRETEFSEVQFFEQLGETWVAMEKSPVYSLQDPFVTRIHGELVFGGVQVQSDPSNSSRIVSWVTQFFRGKDVNQLRPFATGPSRMKDIRLVQLRDGAVGVFTRPQGTVGGRGKIGFFKIDKLDDLTSNAMEMAPPFEDQFIPDEWGGVNEAHMLANGLVGVLGHVACFDERGGKHYYSMTFALDPNSLRRTPLKIIAVRNNFQSGVSKSPFLEDVIFSGGIRRLSQGKAALYAGVSDAEAHCMILDDPFLVYEGLHVV